MIKFRKLLTGRFPGGKNISTGAIRRERLAAAMAWQILNIYPLRRLPRTWQKYKNLRGVLLADEVGGGKTFEAWALIAKHFLEDTRSNRDRFRVLIIASKSIHQKWWWCPRHKCTDDCDACNMPAEYDRHKFLEQAKKSLSKRKYARLKTFFERIPTDEIDSKIVRRKSEWKHIDKSRQGIWLTSIPALPPAKGRNKTGAEFDRTRHIKFPRRFFDWIIADEAHVVRSGYRDTADEALPTLNSTAIRKLHAVLNASPEAKLLLLTATPFQNNVNELMQLISLVERTSDRESLTDLIKSGLKGFQGRIDELRRSPEDFTEESIRDLYEGLDKDISKFYPEDCDGDFAERPAEMRREGNGLDDFISDVMVRNTKAQPKNSGSLIRLSEKEQFQYLLMRDLVYADKSETDRRRDMASVNLSELVSSDLAFVRTLSRYPERKRKYELIRGLFGKTLFFESKYKSLEQAIEAAQKKLKDKKGIVVYCRFIPTLEEIVSRLSRRFGRQNIFQLSGKQKILDRDAVIKQIKATQGFKVLVVSQVGNEGLDFDSFAKTVIHFDGHYNPAVMDQRNGRVYRRDNTVNKLRISQLLLNETYDQRIKFLELEKRKMKNFYLGDDNMNAVLEQVLENAPHLKRSLAQLRKFKIVLEPKREWLLPKAKKQL